MNKKWILILLIVWFKTNAQIRTIENVQAIKGFYNQLKVLENKNSDKVRITHIGDSHIQADFFTGKMRKNFQNYYGNAGLGFSFPYKLAKTNGNRSINYATNGEFIATRNIFADSKMSVGLSGYAFESKTPNTAIKISTDSIYKCDKITVLCSNPEELYFAKYNATTNFEKLTPKQKIKMYRVKSGESLSIIAQKHKVSISSIRKINKIKKNLIYPKQKLKIPTKVVEKVKVNATDFSKLECKINDNCLQYEPNNNVEEVYLFSENKSKNLALNGLIFENNQKGIIYNAIGINGAKCNDFNKYPLFFKQLSHLKSNLIIVSLGTNESFDNLKETLFIERFLTFITNLRKENPSISILVTTPPPSLFKRRYKNTFVEKYIVQIKENMYQHNYAVWDLYETLGGYDKIKENYKKGWMAKDRIHYTKEGYYQQANLLFEDLMQFSHN